MNSLLIIIDDMEQKNICIFQMFFFNFQFQSLLFMIPVSINTLIETCRAIV